MYMALVDGENNITAIWNTISDVITILMGDCENPSMEWIEIEDEVARALLLQ